MVSSDAYLLYELLTGTTPLERMRFKEAAWDEIRRMIREEEPAAPSTRLSSTDTLASLATCRQTEPAKLTKQVRGELDWIVMKALEKDRTRRYETALGLARDLQRYLDDEIVEARPPSAGYRIGKFVRRHRGALTTTMIVATSMILGTLLSIWQAVRATHAERTAQRAERLAQEAKQQAVVERDQSEARRQETEAARQNLRRTLYAADMELIQAAWEGGRISEVLKLLDQKKAENPDLCGFEWNYWMRQAHQDERAFTISGAINHHSFSADGTRYTTVNYRPASQGGGSTFAARQPYTVWDTATGKEIAAFPHPDSDGMAPGLSADGSLLAAALRNGDESAPHDHTVFIGDVNANRPLVTIKGLENSGPLAPSFSLDGRQIAAVITPHGAGKAAVPGAKLYIWETRTGKEIRVIPATMGNRQHPAFSPDGKKIAAVTQTDGGPFSSEVKVWDVASGEQISSFPIAISAGGSAIWVSFSPDRQALAVVGELPAGCELQVWDLKIGRPRLAVSGPSGSVAKQPAAFSPDSRAIACVLGDSQVGVWDAALGKKLALYQGHLTKVEAVAFSRDGRSLSTADASGTVKVWSVPSSPNSHILDPKVLAYHSVLSPDGARIATVAYNNKDRSSVVKVWNATGELRLSLERATWRENETTYGRTLCWSARGHRLACLTTGRVASSAFQGVLTVWDGDGKQLFHVDRENVLPGNPALSPDGTRVAAPLISSAKPPGSRGGTEVWDVASGRSLCRIPTGGAVAFDRDSNRLAGVEYSSETGKPTRLVLWDVATGSECAGWEVPTAGRRASSIAFSPDGERIAATIQDFDHWHRELIVCDVASGTVRRLGQASTGVTFSRDGSRLAAFVGSILQTPEIGLWDVATGRQVLVLKGHAGFAQDFGIAFIPDRDQILSVTHLAPDVSRPTSQYEFKIWDGTPWTNKP
jgi:WD40 repeat protein